MAGNYPYKRQYQGVRVYRMVRAFSARTALRLHPYPLSPCYNTTLHRARSPILYSQPLLSLFCEVQNLDTEGFQLAGSLLQHSDLMRDRNVGKVRVDGLYNLIIVVGEFLKLEIKIVQPGDELRLRRIASDDYEFLAEESFDNKSAAVMLRSGFAEQFVKADVLLLVKPKRVFITRRSGLLVGLVCLFSVSIHYIA